MRTVVFSVLLVSMIACSSEVATKVQDAPSVASESPEPEPAPETFKVGDVILIGDWGLQVHELVDPLKPPNQFFKPDAGNKYVAVDMEVTNKGEEVENFSILLGAKIKNDENQSYTISITSGKEPGPPNGEIGPGDSLRGWAVFEVPKKRDKYRLVFEGDVFSSGQAIVHLN